MNGFVVFSFFVAVAISQLEAQVSVTTEVEQSISSASSMINHYGLNSVDAALAAQLYPNGVLPHGYHISNGVLYDAAGNALYRDGHWMPGYHYGYGVDSALLHNLYPNGVLPDGYRYHNGMLYDSLGNVLYRDGHWMDGYHYGYGLADYMGPSSVTASTATSTTVVA